MRHWKVYLKDKVIHEGGTRNDCWNWIKFTYAGLTLKEILDDGVRIR